MQDKIVKNCSFEKSPDLICGECVHFIACITGQREPCFKFKAE